MIALSSISGEHFHLNSDLIYRIDRSFDTIITLVDGKTIRVADTEEEVVAKVIEFKKNIYGNVIEVKK